MKNHKRVEPHSSVKSAARIRCLRFLPVLLLGALLFTGCVKQRQAPQPAPPQANVVRPEQAVDVIEAARTHIGLPYRYGGSSPQTGFDCSGLICWAYEQVGIQLPRSARDQFYFGEKVERKDLQPGDIVLFKGTNNRSGWHAGLYSGNGMFVHSPRTGKTVTETSLDTKYYAKHYAGARRIPRDGSAKIMMAEYMEKQRAIYAANKGKKSSKKSTAVASSQKKKGNATVAASSGKKKNSAVVASASKKNTVKSSPPKKNTQVVAQKKSADKKPLQTAAANRGKNTDKKAEAVVGRLQSQKPVASKNARASASGDKKPASGKKKGS